MRRLKVKEVAQSKGITMTKLHHLTELNYKTIYAVWHNPQHDVTLRTLEKIAKALGVSILDLIEDVPEE